jgi:Uma2 family endonuclease
MSATKTMLTAQEFDNYPFEEDKRYELDEGELIETEKPAYWHNRVSGNLLFELDRYLRNDRLGEVLISENVYALFPNTRRSPDVAVVLGDRHEELRDAKVIPIIPEIAAEVLSPSETPRMIPPQAQAVLRRRVKEVWLIDPDSREVEIWTGPTLPDRALTAGEALVSPLLPGFALPLADLFA